MSAQTHRLPLPRNQGETSKLPSQDSSRSNSAGEPAGYSAPISHCVIFPAAARTVSRYGPQELIHFARDGDASLSEDVGNLRIPQARGIVFESKMVSLFVDVKFA